MKKTIFFIGILFVSIFSLSYKADANVCLLASESGAAADNCDNGSPSHSMLNYGSKTYSKLETQTSCDNVNNFVDPKQAQEYALSHEFDAGLGQGRVDASNVTFQIVRVGSSSCVKPICKYSSRSDCKNGTHGPCCKSLLNNECWRKCNVCSFNNISKEFYPYADQKMEECKLIGEGGLDYHSSVYTNHREIPSYKINSIRNLIQVTYDEENQVGRITGTEAWTCRPENFMTVLTECITASRNAEIIVGFDEKATYSGHLCIDGRDITIPNNPSDPAATLKSFINQFGGCPASAIKCDSSNANKYRRYFSDVNDCETLMGSRDICTVVETYSDFGDTQCWHGAKTCSDFGHGEYIAGPYSSLDCDEFNDRLKNTEKKYYCGSSVAPENCNEGTAIKLNGRECAVCECKPGFTRVTKCNDVFYDNTLGYYRAEERCNLSGYTVAASAVSDNNCKACPYNAMFWKCN